MISKKTWWEPVSQDEFSAEIEMVKNDNKETRNAICILITRRVFNFTSYKH